MELYFCDRCNTSIPQRDVDAGVAILRAGRAFCSSCKRILTGEEAPLEVLFCDFCNVSVSIADVRNERAVFREGRLYCPKCKILVADRTLTTLTTASTTPTSATASSSSGTDVSPMTSPRPEALVPAAPAAPRPRLASKAWSWLAVILLGAIAGLLSFHFAPDVSRAIRGDSSVRRPSSIDRRDDALAGRTGSMGANGPTSLDETVELGPYLLEIDSKIERLRREVVQDREAERERASSEILALKDEFLRALDSAGERSDSLRREVDALRLALTAFDRRDGEPPIDEPSSGEGEPPGSSGTPAGDRDPSTSPAAFEPEGSAVAKNETLPRELERLKSPDAGARFSAVVELGRLADPSAIPALAEVAINDGDNYVRDFAVRVLGNFDVPAVIPYLIRALHDSDSLVASSANEGLVRITKRSFGFDRKATNEQRQEAIRKWEEWWEKNRESFK